MDTCSTCDEFNSKVKSLETESKNCSIDRKREIEAEIRVITTSNTLHKRRAQTFYDRKKVATQNSKTSAVKEAICFDYGRNLPIPNVSTNDVYYRRQLSLHAFNITVLSSGKSYFYLYTETVGKRGSDDVCSLLHDFVYNHLPLDVKEIYLFCDSCGGQNKNFTVFRFMHYLVHFEKRFTNITLTYPVRGHSYLDCDRQMALLNPKAWLETPTAWKEHFQAARQNPSPFIVNLITQETEENNDLNNGQNIFRKWTEHLTSIYRKRKFPIRPIKELMINNESCDKIHYRTTYNGAWEQALIVQRNKLPSQNNEDFTLPDFSYEGKFIYIGAFTFHMYNYLDF